MLALPGSYVEYLESHGISVAGEQSWCPIIQDVRQTDDSLGMARALAGVGVTTTNTDNDVNYLELDPVQNPTATICGR